MTVWRKDCHLGKLAVGQFFGEAAVLLNDQVRTATVRTDTTADLRLISHEAFLMQLRKFPRAQAYFMKIAKRRTQSGEEQVAEKQSHTSPHFDFLFLKSANPVLQRGKANATVKHPQGVMQLGLVLDYEGPACTNSMAPLPDSLFEPVRVDQRTEQMTVPPHHIHAALKDYATARPVDEPWA
jgi:hypothetical protein